MRWFWLLQVDKPFALPVLGCGYCSAFDSSLASVVSIAHKIIFTGTRLSLRRVCFRSRLPAMGVGSRLAKHFASL